MIRLNFFSSDAFLEVIGVFAYIMEQTAGFTYFPGGEGFRICSGKNGYVCQMIEKGLKFCLVFITSRIVFGHRISLECSSFAS